MNTSKSIIFPKIYPVACHTDNVGPGSTFVAISGMSENGLSYVELALEKGATKIVIQKSEKVPVKIKQAIKSYGAECFFVDDTRKELSKLSAEKLGHPAKKLSFVGVTGTKGKTTTVYSIEHILKTAGYKTALLSTVENKICSHLFDTQLTTCHPDYLNVFFDLCIKAGVQYVVIEVAAQALTLHRVYGIEFDCVLFTNLSLEHSEFYNSMEEYFDAKCLLFNQLKPDGKAIVNCDDQWGQKVLSKNQYKTFSMLDKEADFYGNLSSSNLEGIDLDITHGGQKNDIVCPTMFGKFNAYNLLGAYALAKTLRINDKAISIACQTMPMILGRLNKYEMPNGSSFFIDYAHNPDSYDAVFSTMRESSAHLIAVFGAGGSRDKNKRPLMGSIAAKYCDIVILTSDNPRSEDPKDIVDAIIEGIDKAQRTKVIIELDRKKAIELAYKLSLKDSIVMLLGKGPDEYQIIGGHKDFFSEKLIVQSIHRKRV